MIDTQDRATIESVIRRARAKFKVAARRWERGNNSGDPATLRNCEEACRRIRAEGAALLAPYGIKIDYPGLFPCFTVNGRMYIDLDKAMEAALS